jgi:hypothetical protein
VDTAIKKQNGHFGGSLSIQQKLTGAEKIDHRPNYSIISNRITGFV